MSEAELHVLQARMRGGILNKAKRGELKVPLPIGFVYDDQDRVTLDPDQQIRETLRLFFQTFRRTGSAFATVMAFNRQGLKFPRRLNKGFHKGELVWTKLVHSRALQILHNPRYAGAYFYGKTQVHKTVNGTKSFNKMPRDDWHVFIPNAHVGYISWEEFEENQRILLENAQAHGIDRRKSPPREGPALLQGLVICGVCGNRMTVRYNTRGTRIVPDYLCQRQGVEHAEKICQQIPGAVIDEAIGELLLEVVTPLALEVTLAIQDELNARRAEVENLYRQQVERLCYEAELARRRYMRVDPDNRLVADELEADWNKKLRELIEVQEKYEKYCAGKPKVPDDREYSEIQRIVTDFPRLWRDASISILEHKEYGKKGKPKINWDSQAAKQELLTILVNDARKVKEFISDTTASDELKDAVNLLQLVAEQDIEEDNGQIRIKQGVAKDRIISVKDPEMRHGHKTTSYKTDGYKGHIMTGGKDCELVTATTVTPANASDESAVEELVE